MLHLLLIILLVVVIWKVAASPGRANPQAIHTGLHRMQVVLAVLGGFFGGLIGYAATSHSDGSENPGAILLGAGVGFVLVWGAMGVLIWIVSGFTGTR